MKPTTLRRQITSAPAIAAAALAPTGHPHPLLADDGAREHTADDEPTSCKYDWCSATGPHYDHFNHDQAVATADGTELVAAGIVYLSGSIPSVYVQGASMGPDEAIETAAELRILANWIEDCAQHVLIARALENLRKVRATADGPFAEVLDIMAAGICETGDPAAVGERILELLAQVRAEQV